MSSKVDFRQKKTKHDRSLLVELLTFGHGSRSSQTPDMEEYQNQSHIMDGNIQEQDQLREQGESYMGIHDLMAGLDSISWFNGDDFNFSDETFTSSSNFGCLSFPSSAVPQSCAMHPQNKPLANLPANSYSSFSFFSSAPSPTWSTNQFPCPVPRSLHQCSSEVTVQSLLPNPTPVAETLLGLNSSEQFPGNVLMVDELDEHTIQPSKFDLPSFGFDKMNNSGGIGGEEKESGDDVAKFIHEWLEKNKDVISLEDIRAIRLKNSTIERAERHLGQGLRGRMQLVQLVLMWVQNHHLKKKRQKMHEPDESNGFLQDCSTTSGFATSPLFTTGLQPTQYCAGPTNPLYHQEQNMASMPSAAREAQEKRMERKRKMAHKQNHALGETSSTMQLESVELERHDTGNCNFWSSLAVNPQKRMEFMDPCLLFNGSSSNSQIMQTMHGSGHPVSSVLWPGNSATWKRQILKFQDGYLKFVLQKVLKRSDVGNLGRIVLPKKEAEINLPELDSKDGMIIPMEEIGTSRIWKLRYRFWPNNNSRMYVLENTGTYILSSGLKEGDCIQIYSDLNSGKYMIRGMKARRLQDKRGK